MEASTTWHLTIGAVAKESGVSIDAIRYYERMRLLPAPRRRPSGYRDYAPATIAQLRFIRRAKELGFTLEEVRELLTLSTDRERGVKSVKARATQRLAEVEARIRELECVRTGLRELIDACPGHGPLEHCPILQALGGDARRESPKRGQVQARPDSNATRRMPRGVAE